MCTLQKKNLKKKIFKKKLLSLLCSNWRNFGSFLFGFRLAEMFEPVFGLEYHLPSFMNSIFTFQKKKKNSRHYWIQIWEILVLSFFRFRLVEMFEPVFGLEYHLLSFVNPILTFQKKNPISCPFSRMRFTTFVPRGASTPFRVYCIHDRHICISNLISFYLEWPSLLGNLN